MPALIADGGTATYQAVSCGNKHTCAIRSNGQMVCFGDNSYGQSGQDPMLDWWVPTPASVAGGVAFKRIAAGGYHTCALRASDGRAVCFGGWGRSVAPVTCQRCLQLVRHRCIKCWWGSLQGSTGVGNHPRTAVDCVTSSDVHLVPNAGYKEPAGSDMFFTPPNGTLVSGDREFTHIAAGAYHTCALTPEGRAWCWGT